MLRHNFADLEVYEASEDWKILRWMHLKPGISCKIDEMVGNYINEYGKSYI